MAGQRLHLHKSVTEMQRKKGTYINVLQEHRVRRVLTHASLLAHVPDFETAILAAAHDARAVVDERHAGDSVCVSPQLEQAGMGHEVPYDDVSVGAAGDCLRH